jgi:hypothetical protein
MSPSIELDRDEARELAERELAHPRYDSDPSLLQRAVEWLIEQISALVAAAGGALNGVGGLVLLVLIVLVVTAILLRYGSPARRHRSHPDAVFSESRRSAREYRAAADAAAAAGRWSEAVTERFRAIIADLAERAFLDAGPGMTANEAAWEAARALPDLASELPPAAALFDAVYYGGLKATPDDDRRLRAIESAVRDPSRPNVTEGSAA